MGRLDVAAAKMAYRKATEMGNRDEEARLANNVGDILKNDGEYVEALKWFLIDYDISVKYLPGKDLLSTCQSLGEIYLHLEDFEEASMYQKKHLQFAEDVNDIVEKQRACTQLGRTYHEIFLRSEDDCDAIQSAKKYFKKSMELAQGLKEKPPIGQSCSFLEEYINAHNNIGMLDFDLDNPDAAHSILKKGLQICDEEEVKEYDAMRSRLHHNLGNVFMELRSWDEAKKHIEMDINICHRINHCQGEAKGYINLAELHYRTQNYENGLLCYGKASTLAKSMQDENALVGEIEENIKTVKKAIKIMEELREEELLLKKLSAEMTDAKGTFEERKSMLQVHACLERLIEKSSMVFAWVKHLEFSKRKKQISDELCDKEKLSDAFLVVGKSYQKLRNFRKSLKWLGKSYVGYEAINNLEGQALAKINIGDALDCIGEWTGALQAFEEGYRIALKADLPLVQISALEHMHYIHMIRCGNAEQARELKKKVQNLNESEYGERPERGTQDECSETDSEGHGNISHGRANARSSPEPKVSLRSESSADLDEANEDVPLVSFLPPGHRLLKRKNDSGKLDADTDQIKKDSSAVADSQQTVVGRKRIRVILSDDESETEDELGCPKDSFYKVPRQNEDVSEESMHFDGAFNYTNNPAIQDNVEEGFCSYTSLHPIKVASNVSKSRPWSNNKSVEIAGCSKRGSQCDAGDSYGTHDKTSSALVNFHAYSKTEDQKIKIEIENEHMALDSSPNNDESMKVELTCLFYLQLLDEEKSKGLLPIIHHLEYGHRVLKPLDLYEIIRCSYENVVIKASINGRVHKRLMKLYMECCQKLSEKPSFKLLSEIRYISEVEDDINVSECEQQDISAAPLLSALHVHNAVPMLDLSHNMLGNGTMEKLNQHQSPPPIFSDSFRGVRTIRFWYECYDYIKEAWRKGKVYYETKSNVPRNIPPSIRLPHLDPKPNGGSQPESKWLTKIWRFLKPTVALVKPVKLVHLDWKPKLVLLLTNADDNGLVDSLKGWSQLMVVCSNSLPRLPVSEMVEWGELLILFPVSVSHLLNIANEECIDVITTFTTVWERTKPMVLVTDDQEFGFGLRRLERESFDRIKRNRNVVHVKLPEGNISLSCFCILKNG